VAHPERGRKVFTIGLGLSGVAEPREVFEDAAARALDAMVRLNSREAARWIADLLYYAQMQGLGDKYLKLLDRLVAESARFGPSFAARLGRSLDAAFEGMLRKTEAAVVGDLARRAIAVKEGRLGPFLQPTGKVKESAKRIVDEVFG
jgi:hypothetical protein